MIDASAVDTRPDADAPVVIAICSPLEPAFVAHIEAAFPGQTEVRYRADLVPQPRFAADHGDPNWVRTPAQSAAWRTMLADAEVAWGFPTDGADGPLQLCRRLQWIQTTSAGVGPAARHYGLGEADIIVTTASGIHAGPLAEFVFAALLYRAKEIPRLLEAKAAQRWERFCGGELRDQTLAIVGPGRIGREVARLGRAFGMTVWATARDRAPGQEGDLGVDRLWSRSELPLMLAGADAVVLAMPLTAETEGMIGAAEIAAMKRGATLVNIARGAVIDETALLAALRSGQIGFAALDVFQNEPLPVDSPFWSEPNVLISSHSASTASAENRRIVDIFLANLERWLAGSIETMAPRLNIERGY